MVVCQFIAQVDGFVMLIDGFVTVFSKGFTDNQEHVSGSSRRY